MSTNGWYGVDLDGTLAHYNGWKGADHIGEPIQPMVGRVHGLLAQGYQVKVFTARVYENGTVERSDDARRARAAIRAWTKKHIGVELEATCVKDFAMIGLFDDRCFQVVLNTGMVVGQDVNTVQVVGTPVLVGGPHRTAF